jgi:hypothetical protein
MFFFLDNNIIRFLFTKISFYIRTKILSVLSFVLSKEEKNKPNLRKKKNTNSKNKGQGSLGTVKTSFTNITTTTPLFYLDIGIYATYSGQI